MEKFYQFKNIALLFLLSSLWALHFSLVKMVDADELESEQSGEYTLDNPTENSILNIDFKRKTIYDRNSSQP